MENAPSQAAPTPPGIGVDLLEIDRLEHALSRRPGLEQRVFTQTEREYAAARRRPGRHLAVRFCAKEAVSKALGLSGWCFAEVEVVRGDGPAEVRLSGAVARRAAELGLSVQVSLTHSERTACAVALLR